MASSHLHAVKTISPDAGPIALHALPTGQQAVVSQVLPDADGKNDNLTLRLTEIGFVPGESVRIMARGFAGRDPLAVRIGHTTFAMRRHEAARILVQPEGRHAQAH